MQSSWFNQPTLTSIMPSLNDQVVQDQEEDKSASHSREYIRHDRFKLINI